MAANDTDQTSSNQDQKCKPEIVTTQPIKSEPRVEWQLKDGSNQIKVLQQGWKTNNDSIVYELLNLYTDKQNKFWINNLRRALHGFKPPQFDIAIWDKFHELFKSNVKESVYCDALSIILPTIAASQSLEKSFKILQSKISIHKPALRCLTALLRVCCDNIKTEKNIEKSIEIALKLYKITQNGKEYAFELSQTSAIEYFENLFEIFAHNKTEISDFNILFAEFTKNKKNKILVESLGKAVVKYFKTIENIEIFENLTADMNGYLYFDSAKENKLSNVKLPKFILSQMENSEIWEQLRLTQMNDKSAEDYHRKCLLQNKTRMAKLGMKNIDSMSSDTKSEQKTVQITENDSQNNRKTDKYNQFIKYMLFDGGAQVIIDGANVGHMIRQNCFSFDFIDHIASYYHFELGKKVRIILAIYRVYNAQNSRNERVKRILHKWESNDWLIKVPNMLYDDVLWSICALHSCLIYNGKVIILTNDEMRDHKMALSYKRIFEQFLETKLCRIEIFKAENALCYDPFIEFKQNNSKKRKGQFETDESSEKKQKLENSESNENGLQFIQRSEERNQNNFRSKYEYIHKIFPYKIHEPYPFVIKPQFYHYNNGSKTENELIWFVPQISNCSDIQNPQNMLKHAYSDKILQQRIRWIVARLKRPMTLL